MRGRSCRRRRWSPLLNRRSERSQFRHQLPRSLLLNRLCRFWHPLRPSRRLIMRLLPNRKSEVRVTVDLANLRGGAGMEQPVVSQARRGQSLQLLERRNRWLHVHLGELDAWLHVTLAEELSVNGATVSGRPTALEHLDGAPSQADYARHESRAPPRRRPRSLRESNILTPGARRMARATATSVRTPGGRRQLA